MYNNLQKQFPDNEHTRKYLKEFPKMAEQYTKTPIKVLTYSKFRLFRETGSRIEYEADYIDHRKRLDVMFAMVMSGHMEYLHELEDIICAICEEYTWALPAHIHADYSAEQTVNCIDLFASETAFALSEILYICSDILCDGVKQRMRCELMRRIVKPYINSHPTWPKSNWSGVCIAGVVNTFIYLGLDRDFEAVKPWIMQSMETFLLSYEEDGCCKEGVLYWSYGFGNFVYAANLLREYTKGEIDYFSQQKVKKIAQFGFSAYFSENVTIPYSDGPHYFSFNIGLYHFLKKEYPNLIVPDEKFETNFGDEQRYRYGDFSRNIFWYDENIKRGENKIKSIDYPVSQWYIRNKPRYAFSCKGGHNDEPHNHNDIGSFFVIKNSRFILDDLGWPEYDRDYFDTTKRYSDYICSMSEGHSLPIINGKGQAWGKDHRAELVSSGENVILLDISGAYDINGLKVIRTFELCDEKIVITDEISGADTVTERFVTRIKPNIKNNEVSIEDSVLSADYDAEVSLSICDFVPRKVSAVGMKPVETAYLIDFTCGGNGSYRYTFKV